jgi:branched-chain amino acid transport system ATP-binding protein
MIILKVEKVTKFFEGLIANNEVDLVVNKGSITGLIGPNGAGKTTLFNCIAGVYKPDNGRIIFNDINIVGWPPQKICRVGIARTFQVPKPFITMNVIDNVIVGALIRYSKPKVAKEKALEVLDFVGLYPKRLLNPDALTIADLKRLEIARALATEPKLLMLDEAMAGLNPAECQDAVRLIKNIQAEGITILMIEHVMEIIIPVSNVVTVIDNGKNLLTGSPDEVVNDPRVITAYLGE